MKQKGYKYLGNYKLPTLYCCLLQNWAKNNLASKYNLPNLKGKTLYLDGHLFFGKRDWDLLGKITREEFHQKSDKFFEGIFRLMDKQTKKILAISQKIRSQKEASYQDWKTFFKAINHLEYPWIVVLPVSDELEKLIRDTILKYKLPAKMMDAFRIPNKKTPILDQKEEAGKIKKYLICNGLIKSFDSGNISKKLEKILKNDKLAYKKIIKHVEKYKWFGMMHFWGEPFSTKKLFSQMEDIDNSRDTVNKPNNYSAFPDNLKWILPITQKLAYWRNYVAEVCSMASYVFYENFPKVIEKFGLNYEMAIWMTPQEFLESLKAKKSQISKEALKARKKSYGIVSRKGDFFVVVGKEINKYFSYSKLSKITSKIIRGNVACSGVIRGRVKKISSPDELGKVKRGDVFVASETTPDYVFALKLAGAIIADNGGITSHAAIISRELNIPCIVGTKIATEVLEDGDLVEVDANNGIIKIINNKKR